MGNYTGSKTLRFACSIHSTPSGQTCQHCRDQGELIPRSDAARQTGRKPGRSRQ